MDLKTQSLVSSKSQTIKVVDLFDLSNATKYIVLNVYGSQSGAPSGTLLANNKAVPYTKFYPNTLSKTIIFESKNGVYTNSKHGDLSKITFKTSGTTGALNVITAATVNAIDPSYYSDNVISSINLLTNKITPVEYSSAIFTGSVYDTSVNNLISVAKSYVGKTWDVRQPWDLVQSMAAQIGTSLPISSIGHSYDAISNGNWQLKYNGNKPFGDWKTLLNPGDVIMMTSPDLLTDTVAVVTSGSNENAKVVNVAVNSTNKTGNIVKILPEHLLSSEDVYDLATPADVFIYSLKVPTSSSSIVVSKPAIPNTIKPPIPTGVVSTPNTPYTVTEKYTQIAVTPKPDLTFGLNETFSVQLTNIFTPQSKYQTITQSISGLPSWAKYNPSTKLLTGKTPNTETTAHLSIKGAIGSAIATDFMDIIVSRNKLVDVQDTIWKAGYNNSISINKGVNEPYYFTSNSKLNLSWLHIDQKLGTMYGIPPLPQIGQSIDITVYQQASPRAPQDHVDSFYINIEQPINLIGSPLVSSFT
jgi:hypothetical protein